MVSSAPDGGAGEGGVLCGCGQGDDDPAKVQVNEVAEFSAPTGSDRELAILEAAPLTFVGYAG
jgi:hypothetical protein